MELWITIGPGELLDRISILELKIRRLGDPAARARAAVELAALRGTRDMLIPRAPPLERELDELRAINDRLWQAEDAIRACESAGDFGPAFVDLARSIYHINDLRAALKRRVNDALGSTASEDKSYSPRAMSPPPSPEEPRWTDR
jgi:hypothetical protein